MRFNQVYKSIAPREVYLLERSTAVEHISGHPIGCSELFRVIRTNLESHTETHQNRFA